MRKTTDQSPEEERGILPLRQGDIIKVDTTLLPGQSSSEYIVISHDCDIYAASLKEPSVEVIPVSVTAKADSRMTNAKNSRALVVAAVPKGGGEEVALRIEAVRKACIDKVALAKQGFAQTYALAPGNLRILADWLSLRYRRAALPNEFAERFEVVEEPFWKIISKLNYQISGVLLLFEEGQERAELARNSPYVISILLVYPDREPYPLADDTPEKVRELFESKFALQLNSGRGEIEVKACFLVSEHAITLSQYKSAIQLGSEGISYESDPPAPMIDH